MFNVIIFFAGAALMLVMAVRASRARLALVNKGVKVQAVVAGTIQNRDGVSLALAFTTPSGDTRRLPYPVPRKARACGRAARSPCITTLTTPKRSMWKGTRRSWGPK